MLPLSLITHVFVSINTFKVTVIRVYKHIFAQFKHLSTIKQITNLQSKEHNSNAM